MVKKVYSELTRQYHEINLSQGGYESDFGHPEKNVKLQDDFYNIISDSFQWIESKVPNGSIIKGLDYCGISELDQMNTLKFRKIIASWHSLFELGDKSIELRDYTDYEEEEGDVYHYFLFDKKELLSELSKIIKLCDEALEKNTGITVFGL